MDRESRPVDNDAEPLLPSPCVISENQPKPILATCRAFAAVSSARSVALDAFGALGASFF